VQTWICKLGPTQLLITCHDKETPAKSIRYWGTTFLEANAQSVLRVLAVRWSVEVRSKMVKTFWEPTSINW